jgi:glycosyltransferase involved in cell wall biosynthesis
MKLTSAMIVKNEANRYLERVLKDLDENTDQIIVLDDGSTDETPEICESYGAIVHRNNESKFWKAENELRLQLWREILPQYDHDWILSIDADEMMEKHFWDVKDGLLEIPQVNQWTARIMELWGSEDYFRADGYWNPTHVFTSEGWRLKQETTVLCRWLPSLNYMWGAGNLHCGRTPINQAGPVMSSNCFLIHYGWADGSKHKEKYQKYMENDPNPNPAMRQHYESILNPPALVKRWID